MGTSRRSSKMRTLGMGVDNMDRKDGFGFRKEVPGFLEAD